MPVSNVSILLHFSLYGVATSLIKNTLDYLVAIIGHYSSIDQNVWVSIFVKMSSITLDILGYVPFVIYATKKPFPQMLFQFMALPFRRLTGELMGTLQEVVRLIRTRFPDATEEELERAGHLCAICRAEMTHAKRMPCGHIFHEACIKEWMVQQPKCPVCLAPLDQKTKAQPPHADDHNNEGNHPEDQQQNAPDSSHTQDTQQTDSSSSSSSSTSSSSSEASSEQLSTPQDTQPEPPKESVSALAAVIVKLRKRIIDFAGEQTSASHAQSSSSSTNQALIDAQNKRASDDDQSSSSSSSSSFSSISTSPADDSLRKRGTVATRVSRMSDVTQEKSNKEHNSSQELDVKAQMRQVWSKYSLSASSSSASSTEEELQQNTSSKAESSEEVSSSNIPNIETSSTPVSQDSLPAASIAHSLASVTQREFASLKWHELEFILHLLLKEAKTLIPENHEEMNEGAAPLQGTGEES